MQYGAGDGPQGPGTYRWIPWAPQDGTDLISHTILMVTGAYTEHKMNYVVYIIREGGRLFQTMQYRAGVRNTTFFMQSPTASAGCKNEINLDRGSNTQKRSAWPTDVPSCLVDRPPKPPRQCHHSLETSGSSAWNILSRQAFQARLPIFKGQASQHDCHAQERFIITFNTEATPIA